MHYSKVKSILSPKNGMNLYRGCTHGCIYCDSRSSIYNINHKFEDIEVKENGLELLRKALKNKKEKVMVGTGSMADPYMPIEKRLKYTRSALELIYRYGHGFTCITKSDLILRDLDLIKKVNEKSKAVVQMTLTTADEDLCKILEPHVCTTKRRVEVLKKLNEENIPTVVWLCPVLPFINDTEENINKILDYCIDTHVKGIICFEMGMTLRDGDRQYFYKKLDEHFPGLKKKYITHFKNNYHIPSPYNSKLMEIFNERTSKAGIMNKSDEIFDYLHEFPNRENTKQSKLF
ncbi:MAG: radical SAM protein [Methanobrevibacter sp.]|uniref:SPL family radical SAM protein n=1 Tax=Methanobrevibacter sp. TaxID=66852 RepID=UPI0025F8EB2A|nr:radical SAM protein [Methanobrevibacter sp.]MBR0272342.1 radical SAM protein [Methanobrevibacter sp.]